MNKAMQMLAVVLMVVALAGCPPAGQVPNDPPAPAGIGQVKIEGSLYETSEKSIDWNEIVEFFKPRISRLELHFIPVDPVDPAKGIGIPEDNIRIFNIEVIDGEYSAIFLLEEGEYDVYISARDVTGYSGLFYATSKVTVVAGQTKTMAVVLGLAEHYNFHFIVEDLPGEYGESGWGKTVTEEGQYFSSYYRWYPNGYEGESYVVFSSYLPIDFEGQEDRAALMIKDINGDDYAVALGFNIFDIEPDIPMGIPYVVPDWLGNVELDISFQRY